VKLNSFFKLSRWKTMVIEVINLKGKRDILGPSLERSPPNYLYIGRAVTMGGWKLPMSKWHNPFSAKQYGRTGSIERYREYLLNNPKLIESLPELEGKVLACWCSPELCHGHVLREVYHSFNGSEK